MRNFDDVSPNLASLSRGSPPAVTDPRQRVTDLKAAGLASEDGISLTALGEATFSGWERFGVANSNLDDELPRLLIYVLEGVRARSPAVQNFSQYWAELRSHFDPLALIDNWDALYALNYMDFPRDGFAPGTELRAQRVPAASIEFDLTDFARSVGSSQASVDGGERIENAIRGKIPRGRYRSTFCMALEIAAGGSAACEEILGRFGTPTTPRRWRSFSDAQKATVRAIVEVYDLKAPVEGAKAKRDAGPGMEGGPKPRPPLELPSEIDFTRVLVDAPAGKELKEKSARPRAPRKADYLALAKENDEVGRLGEVFALAFERWRLRDHPELAAKVHHASLTDDTLGYDIISFEPDGAERYVEVKSTSASLDTRFFISANEIDAAEKLGESYVILRVGHLIVDPKCCEYRYPFEGKLLLTPTVFSVLPAPA